jgi:hypothetical protein
MLLHLHMDCNPVNSTNVTEQHSNNMRKYSETSIHRFRRGSEKETMDLGKQ